MKTAEHILSQMEYQNKGVQLEVLSSALAEARAEGKREAVEKCVLIYKSQLPISESHDATTLEMRNLLLPSQPQSPFGCDCWKKSESGDWKWEEVMFGGKRIHFLPADFTYCPLCGKPRRTP